MSKKAFSSILILGFFLLVIGFVVRVSKERVTEGYKINENPKLVIGIVVDQMKHQYLTKYWAHYSDRGFKKLIKNGFIAKSNHYGYAQTSTGPGHTTVATGTYPSVHGIIGNSWFDKKLNKSIYCVDDNSYFSVGSESDQGKKSPINMLTTTLADENRIATNFRGKTIGVAIKDRVQIRKLGLHRFDQQFFAVFRRNPLKRHRDDNGRNLNVGLAFFGQNRIGKGANSQR